MQVHRIQDNNNYNTSFGLKLKLSGDTKDLSKKFIQDCREIAKNIGTDKDTATIKFSKKITKDDPDGFGGRLLYLLRNITVNTKIGGKIIHENQSIGYNVVNNYYGRPDYFNHEAKTVTAVKDYLHLLAKEYSSGGLNAVLKQELDNTIAGFSDNNLKILIGIAKLMQEFVGNK